jgi:hypothetical protein
MEKPVQIALAVSPVDAIDGEHHDVDAGILGHIQRPARVARR